MAVQEHMKINVVKDQLNQNTYIFFIWFYDPLFIWICWPQFKYVDIEYSDKVWPVVNTDSNVSVNITCDSGNVASVSLDNLVMAWYLISVFIGTLGSILDSQLNWESVKFQLARRSQRVTLFSDLDQPHPTAKLFLAMLCGVPTPIVPPINT